MRRTALIVLLAVAACFRGAFLAGTICEEDSDCAPRYVCIHDGATTGGDTTTAGGGGQCGTPDQSARCSADSDCPPLYVCIHEGDTTGGDSSGGDATGGEAGQCRLSETAESSSGTDGDVTSGG